MSYTFSFTGTESVLTAAFNPPIFLDSDLEYVMGLTSFETFNSIPNVTEKNNKFKYWDGMLDYNKKTIEIPIGSYEIKDINEYLKSKMDPKKKEFVMITPNNNTLKTHIKSTHAIDFTDNDSVGNLLGFKQKVLKSNTLHISDYPSNVVKVNSLLIECNITTGNYKNGAASHVIHQFFPSVPPGYKIIESPDHVTYLPISVKTITNITIKVLDQDGDLVNFRGETVTIGLHLKSIRNGVSV
jgi:hypothetical protein